MKCSLWPFTFLLTGTGYPPHGTPLSVLLTFAALSLLALLVIARQRLQIRKYKDLLKRVGGYQTQLAQLRTELENVRLQEIQLVQELEVKNKQLTSYSINFIRKNDLIEALKIDLDQLKKGPISGAGALLGGMNRLVEHSVHLDREWEEFRQHFEGVHKDFYKQLKDCYPDLTSHELKLCTLLKLSMNLKEAAAIMGISPESVKKARHRLRKKLGLSQNENLIDHVIRLENSLKNQARQVA
jgi:DNA-binding CsgD family transcriptional regulator